jgi:hypothetical protein
LQISDVRLQSLSDFRVQISDSKIIELTLKYEI